MATPRSILSHCSLLTTLNKSLRTTLESKFPLVSSVLLVRDQISYHIPRARLISQQIMYFWYKTVHFRFTPSPVLKLDCKTVLFFFFLKISKEIGKACRKSSARASHARRTCEAREKKNDCPFSIQWVRSEPEGSKMSSSCQKSVHNSTLYDFDTLGDWFRGRIARVIVCTWLRILTLYPVILKQLLGLFLCEM